MVAAARTHLLLVPNLESLISSSGRSSRALVFVVAEQLC